MATRVKKKNFSSFTYAEAFKYLKIKNLCFWSFEAAPVEPSDFFQKSLMRKSEVFDLQTGEESKKLIIDLICEEVLQGFKHLKIWKSAALSDEETSGYVDYLMAERKAYLEAPFLCIVEAKKDDFEQGFAQCLPEMKACQYNNERLHPIPEVYGIVTNGDGWRFYKLSLDGFVYESGLYTIANLSQLLGILHYIFSCCEQNLLSILNEDPAN